MHARFKTLPANLESAEPHLRQTRITIEKLRGQIHLHRQLPDQTDDKVSLPARGASDRTDLQSVSPLTVIPDGFRKEARPDRQEAYVQLPSFLDLDFPLAKPFAGNCETEQEDSLRCIWMTRELTSG